MKNIHVDVYAKGVDLTEALRDYVVNKVSNLGKYLADTNEPISVHFEIGKVSNHHKSSEDAYEASCRFMLKGKEYFVRQYDENMYAAIDGVKETLYREIRDQKGKRESAFLKGKRLFKQLLTKNT